MNQRLLTLLADLLSLSFNLVIVSHYHYLIVPVRVIAMGIVNTKNLVGEIRRVAIMLNEAYIEIFIVSIFINLRNPLALLSRRRAH